MISLIIPLYNEMDNVGIYRERLFPVIEDISKRYSESFEYVFIDDGSVDKTLSRINEIKDQYLNVKVVPHDINRGMGAAIKTGIANSSGDLLICLDSDLTYRPEDIPILLDAYRETGCDCVSGSPYLKSGLLYDVSFIRLIPSKGVTILYRILLRKKITCMSAIFRLYRREVFDRFGIESNNYEINAEILSKMILNGMSIVEVPVVLHSREYGESKLNARKEIINNLKLLAKIFRTKYLGMKW